MSNILFPGRAKYTGPSTGWFYGIHHNRLCEQSHNILERVSAIKKTKPKHEIPIRLHNLMWLDPVLVPAVVKRAALNAAYEAKRVPLYADSEAKLWALWTARLAVLDAEILEYIRLCIPDCAWNGTELQFGRESG